MTLGSFANIERVFKWLCIGLLVLSAVVNGIAAGPFLIVVMLISRDGRLMGTYKNGKLAATLGWTATVVMSVAGVVGLWLTVAGS